MQLLFLYLFDNRYKVATILLIMGRLSLPYSEYIQVMGKFKKRHNGMTQTREPPSLRFDSS